MKIQDVLTPSFRQLHHQLGHDCTDCHRDHERHPQWVSNLLKRHYLQQCPQLASYMPTFCHFLFDIPEKFNFILHILHIYHKPSVHRPLRSERCVIDV